MGPRPPAHRARRRRAHRSQHRGDRRHEEQIDGLNRALRHSGNSSTIPPSSDHPVVVIGGGKVGRAAARAAAQARLTVHIVDENASLKPLLSEIASRVIIGTPPIST